MLTEADREEISRGIAENAAGKVIAARVGRCSSVVSREIARHGGRAGYPWVPQLTCSVVHDHGC